MIRRTRHLASAGAVALAAGPFAAMPAARAADPLLSLNRPVTASSSGGCCAAKYATTKGDRREEVDRHGAGRGEQPCTSPASAAPGSTVR